MTRPLPIAASLVLAALSFAAFAQTQAETETAPPATSEPAPAPASEPAPAATAPVVPTGSAERGKQLTSPSFAQFLGNWRDQGVRDIAFEVYLDQAVSDCH